MSQLKMMRRIACATMLACAASGANAAAIRIDDQSTTNLDVEVFDGLSGDLNYLPGWVTYVGSAGNWVMNVTTGMTNHLDGTNAPPLLHLDSIDAKKYSGGTLDIWFSENDFVGSGGMANFISSIGLNFLSTGGSIALETYMDKSNDLFGTGTLLSSFQANGVIGNVDSATAILPDGKYSLTIHATVTHRDAGTSSFNSELKVPEPGTLSLLGALLVAGGFVSSRRRGNIGSRSA